MDLFPAGRFQIFPYRFGGSDPWGAYDELVDQANAAPIPAPGYAPDPRPITGDDILNVTIVSMYSKLDWGALARMLSEAAWYSPSRDRSSPEGPAVL